MPGKELHIANGEVVDADGWGRADCTRCGATVHESWDECRECGAAIEEADA